MPVSKQPRNRIFSKTMPDRVMDRMQGRNMIQIVYTPPMKPRRVRHILTGNNAHESEFFKNNCAECPAYDWAPVVMAELLNDPRDYQHCSYLGEILISNCQCSYRGFWPELVKEREKNGQTKMSSKSCVKQAGRCPGLDAGATGGRKSKNTRIGEKIK